MSEKRLRRIVTWTAALAILATTAQGASAVTGSNGHGSRPGGGALPPGDSGLKHSAPAHNTVGAGYRRPTGTSHYAPVKSDPHAKRVKELPGRRTANAKFFQMSDGSVQQELSAVPVHYQDAKGTWQDIDTSVKPLSHAGGFTAGAEGNGFHTYFGSQAGSLVRLESGGSFVQMGADAATVSAPKVSGSGVSYPGAWTNTDLDYQVGTQGLKETVVLAKAPSGPVGYSFKVALGGGLTPKQNPNGSIDLFGTESADPVWTIPAPYMADAKTDASSPVGKVYSTKVTQSMSFDARTSTLHLTEAPDAGWLADAHRQYPVSIDPTIMISPNNTNAANVMISADGPTSNYSTLWRLSVGTSATGAARALIKFPMPAIPAGTTITSADLQLYYDQNLLTGVNNVPLQALQANAAWSPTTATWNNASAIGGPVAGATQMNANALAVWDDFPVTSAVQNWVNGSAANNGFVIKATNETPLGQGGARFEGSIFAYNGEVVNYPKLIINYGVPGVALNKPTVIHATGAELSWPAYTNTTGNSANDLAEYQVHRSVLQTFTPSASSEISPVATSQTSFVDSTAIPTPANNSDPYGNAYYYMAVVKTKGGQLISGPTQLVRLPEAGRTMLLIPSVAATTLSSTQPTAVLNTISNAGTPEPWLEVGDNSGTYGVTHAVFDFGQLPQVPANSQILDAHLKLWQETTSTNTSGAVYELHGLTRSFTGNQATWNSAATGTNWTTAGGDFTTTADGTLSGFTNDPNRRNFDATSIVQGWVNTAGTNHGLLVKQAAETSSSPQERTIFAGPATAEPALAPTLVVTYLDSSTGSTYYAPSTPNQMNPGTTYTEPVTINNTTSSTWAAASEVLTYHWVLPDGTDVTAPANQVQTALPSDLAPGATVTLNAQVTPPAVTDGNQQEGYTLAWDMYNKTTGVYLSAGAPTTPTAPGLAARTTAATAGTTGGIASLKQQTGVDTSGNNQLGLEKFYQYTKVATGSGSNLYVNDTGNTVWNDDLFSNPSRGFDTFLRLSYNSLDTYDTVTGFGWSIQASTPTRLGQPLKFFPPSGSPTAVVMDDGTGNAHQFTWNPTSSSWTSPPGVHLFLQHPDTCPNRTTDSAAWTMTRPDGTVINYDCDGYPTAVIDANNNEADFEYQAQTTHGKTGKLLTSVQDPVFRQSLKLTYFAKGDASYQYIDSTGAPQTGTNLTDPAIIDHVKSITDISGREVDFVYTTQGLLARVVDGAGDPQAKTFNFTYDATQGMKNVKLKVIQDPRQNLTRLDYYSTSTTFKWWTSAVTDRDTEFTGFDYAQPSPVAGNTTQTTITDANGHKTVQQLDGNGRLVQSVNAKSQTTSLVWDGDNNVSKLTEPGGAISTWVYNSTTGYPSTATDAVGNAANPVASTTYGYVTYQGGHVAYLTDQVSASGLRHWRYTYDVAGNLQTATSPDGMTTGAPSGYTTTYRYLGYGEVQDVTDANNNRTSYDNYDLSGKPGTMTSPLGEKTTYSYGSRGETLTVTDPLQHTTIQHYDRFLRPTDTTVPKDQANAVYISTPAPQYDANDNILQSTAADGAVLTQVFDPQDRKTSITLPADGGTGTAARTVTQVFDPVGNLQKYTEPLGNAVGATVGAYTATIGYDEINEATTATNAAGKVTTTGYDGAGNRQSVTDPLGNITAYGYDLDHRLTAVTDALGHTSSVQLDADGVKLSSIAANGAQTQFSPDNDGRTIQVIDPANRATQFLFDQVGNQTGVVSPLGVQSLPAGTKATVDSQYTTKTVYDADNRPVQHFGAFDSSSGYGQAQRPETDHRYDADGRVSWESIPGAATAPQPGFPLPGTSFSYFDNGWTKESVDPWYVTTDYDYTAAGRQASRKVTSPDGAGVRTMNWSYYPDGDMSAFTDSGLPAGWAAQVVGPHADTRSSGASVTGTWTLASGATGYQNSVPYTHAAGTGTEAFTWNLEIPQDGDYNVYVSYAPTGGASNAAPYTVTPGTTSPVTVDQTNVANAGTMQPLGKFHFVAGQPASVSLKETPTGAVNADTVKIVRDNSADPAAAPVSFAYSYDLNGNRTGIADNSGARAPFSSYSAAFDPLNRMKQLQELNGTAVTHAVSYGFDDDGNVLNQTYDSRTDAYGYDKLNRVTSVKTTQNGADPGIATAFDYNQLGERTSQTKGNGDKVATTYNPDGTLATQVETMSTGALVDSHTATYDADGRLGTDKVTVQNADLISNPISRTLTYAYSPGNQLTSLTSDDTKENQSYSYNPDGTLAQQQVNGGPLTQMWYDRNRLMSIQYGANGSAVSIDSNRYDAAGRLLAVYNSVYNTTTNTRTSNYQYDSWDHLTLESKQVGTAPNTTTRSSGYHYDSLDRPTDVETSDGTTSQSETFSYLATSPTLLNESASGAGAVNKAYDYAPSGERLAMINTSPPTTGTPTPEYYTYNLHSDVEVVTSAGGIADATYGYTAYGSDDPNLDSGKDKPVANQPAPIGVPFNPYRFNSARVDMATSNYDMGFRTYNPSTAQFTSRDSYGGAGPDAGLAGGNRYGFAGGNPISNVEMDGHSWQSALGIGVLVAGVAGAAICAAATGGACLAAIGAAALDGATFGGEAAVTSGLIQGGIEGAGTVWGAIGAEGTAAAVGGGLAAGGAAELADETGATVGADAAASEEAAAGGSGTGPSCGGESFTADTKVKLADGTSKPISGLRSGDKVESSDTASGAAKTRTGTTSAVWVKHDTDLYDLTVHTAKGDQVVHTTQHHLFYDRTTHSWVEASKLAKGDQLTTDDGSVVTVLGGAAPAVADGNMWDLTIPGDHDFYVMAGDVAVLVHNCTIVRSDDRGGDAKVVVCEKVCLGIAPQSDELGKSLGSHTFNKVNALGLNFGEPNTVGRPLWVEGVENAVGAAKAGKTTIAVELKGLPGETPLEKFQGAYLRWQTRPKGISPDARSYGTAWEMSLLGMNFRLGALDVGQIEWYDGEAGRLTNGLLDGMDEVDFLMWLKNNMRKE